MKYPLIPIMDVEETAWEIEWAVPIPVVIGVQVTDLNQWKNVVGALIETAKVAVVSIETEKAEVVVLLGKACEKPGQSKENFYVNCPLIGFNVIYRQLIQFEFAEIETMVDSTETGKGDLVGIETWGGKGMGVLVEIESNRTVLGRGETVIGLVIPMKEVHSMLFI